MTVCPRLNITKSSHFA